MAGFRSTKSGYVSILFMKMNEIFLHFIAQVTLARRIRRAHACQVKHFRKNFLEDAIMPRIKQASTQKRITKAAAVNVLGAAGLGLVGNASASTMPTTDIPQSDNTSPNQRFVLGEEEMADVSLATFYLFDRENVGSGVQVARGCGGCGGCRGCGGGCRGCGGGCRGCGGGFGGCGFGGCGFGGCVGCVGCAGCAGCAGCCLSWGACRLC